MRKLFLVLLTMVTLLFTSCAKTEQSNPSKSMTDRAGNEFVVPEKMDKLVSMSPAITEILIDLGLGDKIIAIDTYSVGREGLKADLPTFDLLAPDTEKIVQLAPDVIFSTTMSSGGGSDPFKAISDLGITLVYIDTAKSSVDSIMEDILFLSQVTSTEKKGEEIVNQMKKDIAEIAAIGKTITTKKKVSFEIAPSPAIYSFGKGVFLNELIEIMGAENVYSDQEQWISVSDEVAVGLNPDVILTNVSYINNAVDEIKARAGWESVNAIKNNEVYFIDTNYSSLPDQNIIKALKEMAKAVYPQEYANIK